MSLDDCCAAPEDQGPSYPREAPPATRTGDLMLDEEHTLQLVERIVALRPTISVEERRFGMALYLLLARGHPITIGEVAEAVGLTPDDAVRLVDLFADFMYRNDSGDIVGFGGLSVVPTDHAFDLPGVRLYTWCAWDALFIPEIIRQTAVVTSECPATGRSIELTIAPTGISCAEPEGTALSLVVPELEALREDVRGSFCGLVHFFASVEAAREWARVRKGAYVATLEQASELGRMKNAAQFGDMLAV